ncbi:MAG: glycine cleavage system aminomethyltransferase GcvT [Xanthomonadales bacterium]|nr:glycine cleavage system aminomethyltransferase GcvT [Xanthomonadales bacterium]
MSRKTPFYQAHIDAAARMVDFGGWGLPINYGSQIDEHHTVRNAAGMFDVSHMTVVEIKGKDARVFLSKLLANDIAKLQEPGKALYSCMLNSEGGIIDDLITYYLTETHFRMVVNAATHDKDMAWLEKQVGGYEVTVNERKDLAMLAVQGPDARQKTANILNAEDAESALALSVFQAAQIGDLFIARTGYTGEDGFEIMLPADAAIVLWNKLLNEQVKPCGLGARDTLRLEAGMNLYGQDMDETTSPYVSALAWTVALKNEREFIGRSALLAQKEAGLKQKLVGLVLEGRGVLRPYQNLVNEAGAIVGETTSGSFSPTLEKAIAMARVDRDIVDHCLVDIRGRKLPVRLVKMPFARKGRVCDGILD